MSIIQVAKIQHRSGNIGELPQLDSAEFGLAVDIANNKHRLFIGPIIPVHTNTSPISNNIEILTIYSTINELVNGFSSVRIPAPNSNIYFQVNNSPTIMEIGSNNINIAVPLTSNVTGKRPDSSYTPPLPPAPPLGNNVAPFVIASTITVANLFVEGTEKVNVRTVPDPADNIFNLTFTRQGIESYSNNPANTYYGDRYLYANSGLTYHTFIDTSVKPLLRMDGNLYVTGNYIVDGNLTYLNVDTLVIEDPIIEQGTGGNNTSVPIPDNKDRGSLLHFYNPSVPTIPTNAPAPVPSGTTSFNIGTALTTPLYVGANIGCSSANSNASPFAPGTIITSIVGTTVTINQPTVGPIATTDNIVIGKDLLNFMGWDQSKSEFGFGSNVTIDPVTINSEIVQFNQYANTRMGNITLEDTTPNNTTSINTVNSNFNLANSNATTINAFGHGTNINIGNSAGTLTLRNPTVVGVNSVQNLWNTVATTINFGGAADFVNIGNLTGNGNTTVWNNLISNGNLVVNSTVDSTAPTNGALVVAGGVGIGKNLNVGANANILGNTNVTGNTNITANANITGQIYGSSNLFISANANITGNTNITANANVTGQIYGSSNLFISANANITGNINTVGNIISNRQLISTIATGTPPIQVDSTTRVANLYVQGSNESNIQTTSSGNYYFNFTTGTSGNLVHYANSLIYVDIANQTTYSPNFSGNLYSPNSNIVYGNITTANGNLLTYNYGNIGNANVTYGNITTANGNSLTYNYGNIGNANIIDGNITTANGNLLTYNYGNIGNFYSPNVNITGGNINANITLSNNVTFTNNGAGETSGALFNGSANRIISWNTIGAASGNATGWANVGLGPVGNANLLITGGSNGQILVTDGTGNLRWSNVIASELSNSIRFSNVAGNTPNIDYNGNNAGYVVSYNTVGAAQGNPINNYAIGISNPGNTTGMNPTTGNIYGAWTLAPGATLQATYADLAEYYTADANYDPGTVVEFGGTYEITIAEDETTRVAGVISTNPAYGMNANCKGEFALPVALQGRVPCKVRGIIRKGDMMISGGNGYARPTHNPKIGTVIGKSLQDFEGEGVIEIVVGRL